MPSEISSPWFRALIGFLVFLAIGVLGAWAFRLECRLPDFVAVDYSRSIICLGGSYSPIFAAVAAAAVVSWDAGLRSSLWALAVSGLGSSILYSHLYPYWYGSDASSVIGFVALWILVPTALTSIGLCTGRALLAVRRRGA